MARPSEATQIAMEQALRLLAADDGRRWGGSPWQALQAELAPQAFWRRRAASLRAGGIAAARALDEYGSSQGALEALGLD